MNSAHRLAEQAEIDDAAPRTPTKGRPPLVRSSEPKEMGVLPTSARALHEKEERRVVGMLQAELGAAKRELSALVRAQPADLRLRAMLHEVAVRRDGYVPLGTPAMPPPPDLRAQARAEKLLVRRGSIRNWAPPGASGEHDELPYLEGALGGREGEVLIDVRNVSSATARAKVGRHGDGGHCCTIWYEARPPVP
jgi:hypothetical protein